MSRFRSAPRQPTRHFGYNIDSGLKKYKDALALYGSQYVKVYCVGDSITKGEYASIEPTKSWVGVLRSALQARYGDAGEGFINTYEATLPAGANSRWSFGAGWVQTGVAAFGGKYFDSTAATTAATVTFDGTSATVIYIAAPGGGIADVAVDGTNVGTINCSGSGRWDSFATFSGLASGSHTMTITPRTTAKIFLQGIFAEKDTKGIQVHRIGYSGWRASDWNQANTRQAWGGKPPHLVIIALGMNEAAFSVNMSTYKTNMASIINHFQGNGASVLLLPYFRPANSWTPNTPKWFEYVKANYEMADQYNCGLVDIFQSWWESYTIAQANGLFGLSSNDYSGASGTNAAHPSDRGYEYIANIIEPHLTL